MIWWWSGCVEGTGPPVELPDADEEWFVAEVQPVLEASCANPSCHGADDRPFEVFASRRHRLDPDDTWRDTPLTAEELRLNFDRARAFLVGVDVAADCPLLSEPLSAEHGAGEVFEDRREPGYRALRAWVVDAVEVR